MKDKKYNQFPFGINVVEIIEETVKELAHDEWNDDKCPPEFWVSLNNEDMQNQAIMITINHCDIKFTEKLFPRSDTEYGYKSVLAQMKNMDNQTM